MSLEILQDRRVKYGIGIVTIVILLLFLKGCDVFKTSTLTVGNYVIEVNNLAEEDEKLQEDWVRLLDSTAFEDLCTEVYATRFEELGQQFIDIYDTFMGMQIDGNKETKVPNYKQYLTFFETYKEIGKELQVFADMVRKGNYQEAVVVINNLQLLNQQIPIIE